MPILGQSLLKPHLTSSNGSHRMRSMTSLHGRKSSLPSCPDRCFFLTMHTGIDPAQPRHQRHRTNQRQPGAQYDSPFSFIPRFLGPTLQSRNTTNLPCHRRHAADAGGGSARSSARAGAEEVPGQMSRSGCRRTRRSRQADRREPTHASCMQDKLAKKEFSNLQLDE